MVAVRKKVKGRIYWAFEGHGYYQKELLDKFTDMRKAANTGDLVASEWLWRLALQHCGGTAKLRNAVGLHIDGEHMHLVTADGFILSSIGKDGVVIGHFKPDYSMMKNADAKRALCNEVRDQIDAFRRKHGRAGDLSVDIGHESNNTHPFCLLAFDWLRSKGFADFHELPVGKASALSGVEVLTDDVLCADWRAYHDAHCGLCVQDASENRKGGHRAKLMLREAREAVAKGCV